jgi:hypothetical protein
LKSAGIGEANCPIIDEFADISAGWAPRKFRFREVWIGHLMPDPHPFAQALEMGPAERRAVDAALIALRERHRLPIGLSAASWHADLYPCAPLRSEEYNLDWRGRLGLCCQLSGFGAEEGALAADLNEVTLGEGLAALARLRDTQRREKAARARSAAWRDEDHFACWYCAKRLDPL